MLLRSIQEFQIDIFNYKLWASRRCMISHPWHIITRLQCTFSFISCHVGSWWKLMSDDNSLLKCHLRQIIQSVNGCFKSVIFIKTNAHFMACRILMILYFHFAAQQVWRDPMKNLEMKPLKKKERNCIHLPSWYSYWGQTKRQSHSW